MKLRFLAPALALALTIIAVHAQVAVYVSPDVSRISNSVSQYLPAHSRFLGSGRNVADRSAASASAATTDFAHLSKVRDVKAWTCAMAAGIQHGNNASLNSFLVGLRRGRPADVVRSG